MTYFVSNRYDGCWYYRCYLPMLHNGFRGDKTSFSMPKIDSFASARESINADCVVFQRPDEKSRLDSAILLKRLGKKVVFENDDTYKIEDNMKLGEEVLAEKQFILDSFIKIADLVTTTTEYLADEYRKLNKNVVVLKNCIDPADWPTPKLNDTSKVRIGLFGSTTLNGDYEPIAGLLRELSKRPDVQLVMFGLPPKEAQTKKLSAMYADEIRFWEGLSIEWQPFVSMQNYFATLNNLRLDIVLIPRRDNYFNRCKSNLKFLEASILGVPVIAQRFADGNSPYEELQDGVTGFRATTMMDWDSAINQLIKDKELRKHIGSEAKKYVLANYDIRNNFKQWKNAYKTL